MARGEPRARGGSPGRPSGGQAGGGVMTTKPPTPPSPATHCEALVLGRGGGPPRERVLYSVLWRDARAKAPRRTRQSRCEYQKRGAGHDAGEGPARSACQPRGGASPRGTTNPTRSSARASCCPWCPRASAAPRRKREQINPDGRRRPPRSRLPGTPGTSATLLAATHDKELPADLHPAARPQFGRGTTGTAAGHRHEILTRWAFRLRGWERAAAWTPLSTAY